MRAAASCRRRQRHGPRLSGTERAGVGFNLSALRVLQTFRQVSAQNQPHDGDTAGIGRLNLKRHRVADRGALRSAHRQGNSGLDDDRAECRRAAESHGRARGQFTFARRLHLDVNPSLRERFQGAE